MSIVSRREKSIDVLSEKGIGSVSKIANLIKYSEQQDAHELFVELISELDNDVRYLKKRKNAFFPSEGISQMKAQEIPLGVSRVQILAAKKRNDASLISSSDEEGDVFSELSAGDSHLSAYMKYLVDEPSPPLSSFNGFKRKTSPLSFLINRFKTNPFEGLWARRRKCTNCGTIVSRAQKFLIFFQLFAFFKTGVDYSPFTDLPLNIPVEFHTLRKKGKVCTLENCLNELISTETIHDYNCEHCNLIRSQKLGHSTAIPSVRSSSIIKQKTMIGRIPHCLCIHLGRTSHTFDGGESVAYKVPCYVQFPEVLDLSHYCATDLQNDFGFETHNPQANPKNGRTSDKSFSLKAVIVHLGGSSEEGHFVAYKKLSPLISSSKEDYEQILDRLLTSASPPNSSHDQWVKVSDSHISPVRKEQVFSEKAYMLFYERLW